MCRVTIFLPKGIAHDLFHPLITYFVLILSRTMIFITWPFFLTLFIVFNCLRFCFHPLESRDFDNFKTYINIIFFHTSLNLVFTFKLIYVSLISRLSIIILFPYVITIIDVEYLLLRCGDIETQPGLQPFDVAYLLLRCGDIETQPGLQPFDVAYLLLRCGDIETQPGPQPFEDWLLEYWWYPH